MAGARSQRVGQYITSRSARVPHVVLLVLTMTFNNPSSIFKDGRLKPGIYKIQNLFNGGYVDIYEHSREMRRRSAQELEEGRGLVR